MYVVGVLANQSVDPLVPVHLFAGRHFTFCDFFTSFFTFLYRNTMMINADDDDLSLDDTLSMNDEETDLSWDAFVRTCDVSSFGDTADDDNHNMEDVIARVTASPDKVSVACRYSDCDGKTKSVSGAAYKNVSFGNNITKRICIDYVYTCLKCHSFWLQRRPQFYGPGGERFIRETKRFSKGATKKVYKCGICGLPKKNHVCSGIPGNDIAQSSSQAPPLLSPLRACLPSSSSDSLIPAGAGPFDVLGFSVVKVHNDANNGIYAILASFGLLSSCNLSIPSFIDLQRARYVRRLAKLDANNCSLQFTPEELEDINDFASKVDVRISTTYQAVFRVLSSLLAIGIFVWDEQRSTRLNLYDGELFKNGTSYLHQEADIRNGISCIHVLNGQRRLGQMNPILFDMHMLRPPLSLITLGGCDEKTKWTDYGNKDYQDLSGLFEGTVPQSISKRVQLPSHHGLTDEQLYGLAMLDDMNVIQISDDGCTWLLRYVFQLSASVCMNPVGYTLRMLVKTDDKLPSPPSSTTNCCCCCKQAYRNDCYIVRCTGKCKGLFHHSCIDEFKSFSLTQMESKLAMSPHWEDTWRCKKCV